ncbi:MAG: MFS transporter, partial [Deltaproteobacteria bacterium]|nr:MFS transporter [Deltaproteobacteria bacterium]
MENEPRSQRLRWAVCGLLVLATTMNYLDRSVLGLVEPMLKHMLGADRDLSRYNRDYSYIAVCFIVAYGAGFLVSGRLIDRLGTKIGYALSVAVWALASISHAWMRSVGGFAAARFALGLGESGNFPAALKVTADWFPAQKRALATGIFNSGTSVASLLAPALIPVLATHFGWQSAFFTTGSLSLLWLMGWLLFPYDRLRREFGNRSPESSSANNARLPIELLLRTPATWTFAFSKCLTDPVWWLYLFWLPKFFSERFHIDLKHLGMPLVMVYVGASAGSVAGGWLSTYFMSRGLSSHRARRAAMLMCALAAIPVVIVPFVHTLWQAVGILSLATAAHQGWSSNLLSSPADLFPSHSVATVVGIGGATGSLGSSLFTSLVGVLWTHHSLIVFLAGGAAYLIALVAFQWRPPIGLQELNPESMRLPSRIDVSPPPRS